MASSKSPSSKSTPRSPLRLASNNMGEGQGERGITTRLAWNQINKIFSGEWVELVDYSWEWNESHPRWARVRHFASDRAGLLRQLESHHDSAKSLILFISGARSVVEPAMVANL